MNFPTQRIYVFSMNLAAEASSLSGIRWLVLWWRKNLFSVMYKLKRDVY